MNYQLCKQNLDIQKREMDNRYRVANNIISRINYIDKKGITIYVFSLFYYYSQVELYLNTLYRNTDYVNKFK